MPLIRIDTYENIDTKLLKKRLDLIHRAVVESLKVPEKDRYQILNVHSVNQMMLEDTGLGFTRSTQAIVLSITTRPRSKEQKIDFYDNVTRKLTKTGLSPQDILINFTTNSDKDWSFGYGRAQFLTGELS